MTLGVVPTKTRDILGAAVQATGTDFGGVGSSIGGDDRAPEHGAAEHHLPGTRLHGVHPQGRPDKPCAHLATVLVSAQSVGGVGVHVAGQCGHAVGGRAGVARVGRQIRDVVAGLVAVGVLPHESGDVRLNASCGLDRGSKEVFQTGQVPLISTQDVHLSSDIVDGCKEVLPTVGFCEVEVDFSRVKSLNPSTLSFCLDETCLRIHEVFPRRRPLGESRRKLVFTVARRIARDARVVERVFQGF